MKNVFLFVCIIISFFSFSQVLTGKITDYQGREISFVTIRQENTGYGTVSNAGGEYQLEVKKGRQVIKFSVDGYESVIDTIEILSQTNFHNVILSEITNKIDEVVVVPVSAKDKGKEIMKQVIDKRSYFQQLLENYTCDTYCYSTLEKEKKDSLIKDLVIGKEKLNIIEWKAKTSYQAANHYKDEFYAFNDFSNSVKESNFSEYGYQNDGILGENVDLAPSSKVNSNPYLFVNGIKDAHFSIFDNVIVSPKLTQNPIVSPLAYNAFIYYNFYLEKTFFDSLNQMVYEIKIKPKFDYEALFSGTLFIKDRVWEIISYDLSVNPQALLFFNDIHIICDYEKFGEYLVPVRKEFVYTIKEDRTIINGLARVSHSDYTFDLSEKNAKFWLETATYTADAFEKDSSYWNAKRPFTLKAFEKDFMHEQDSILKYHESEEYLRSSDSLRNQFNLLTTVFSGYSHVNSFKKYEFTTIPLIAQVTPFGVGGFRYRFGVFFLKEFTNGKKIYIDPLIDYGFLNKDLKGSFNGAIMYNPLNFSKLGFHIGDTYDYISGTQNILNLFIPKNNVRNQKLELYFSRELINGLYLKNSLLYSDRRAIDNPKFLLQSGVYIQKKELRDIEYKYFRPSDYNFFSNPINTLQLLDTSLRTPNSYLQFNFIHHFNGFFLNKIWGINKLKMEESIGGSFLTIPASNFTQAEFYVGFERRLRIKQQLFKLGLYFVTSDNNLGNANFHFKIGINSFNNFTNKWEY